MKRTFNHILAAASFASLCYFNLSLAQNTSPAEISQQQTIVPDSSSLDSLTAATKSQPSSLSPDTRIKPVDTGIDAKVTFKARSIESRKQEEIIYLTGDAEVQYKEVTIKAGKITIKMKDNLLVAEAIPDTAAADSTKMKYTGYPSFSDGKEDMVGERMEYNFKSEKGRIVRGRTEFQKGYYFGETVKRVDSDVFYVKDGSYSSCDNPEPHFQFRAKKMKVIANDKVLGKPIIFYLGKIPLAIFPFAMFPTQESGRQSGVILPQFGSSQTEGRYLRGMGYYWATSDYMDMQLTMDFYERTGILLHGTTNYALRYKFSGGLDGSFIRKNFQNGQRQRRWSLTVRHNQTINENTSLNVHGTFQSDNSFYREFSNNRNERLNRQISSNAQFSKRWADGKNSLTINLNQVKDIESGGETLTLPQMNFRRGRSAIIPFKDDETGRTKRESKWYNEIYFDYSASLTNTMRDDTTDSPPEDTRNAKHTLNFSHSPKGKLFGVLGLTQSVSYVEDWFDKRKTDITLIDSTNREDFRKEDGFFRRPQFSYTASTNTHLYGTFYPGIFGINAIRHKMSPLVTFSYQPDYTDDYFVTLEDTNGFKRRIDRFQGSPSNRAMSMGFTLNNLFQMKVGKGDKEHVVKLFDLNFGSGYNFAADSLKLSDLSTRLTANPTKKITVSANMGHSFYRYNTDLNRKVDEFIKPRLTSFRVDASWSLGGKKAATGSAAGETIGSEPAEVTQLGATGASAGGEYEDRFAPESAFSALDIPWRASLKFSYSVSKSNPQNVVKSAYIDLSNVEVQITKKWRMGYRLRYDLQDTKAVDQRISFYRDLHCWEARFDWTPSGFSKGYYFIINVKAPHLKQLKLERRGGRSSVFSSPL